MEGVYKAVVRLAYQSGLPEDVAVNDFYFLSSSVGTQAADIASLQTRLVAFYNNVPAGDTKSISDYLGIQIDRAANKAKINYYFSPDIAPPPADWGSPVASNSWTVGAADVPSGMPAEVAACLSFHGDLTDIPESITNPTPPPATLRPAAHRRGRIFVGPWTTNFGSNEGANQDNRITSSHRVMLTRCMIDLEADNDDLEWVVCSQAAGELFLVVGGYVDDAWDTQRRRGSAPGVRTLWP